MIGEKVVTEGIEEIIEMIQGKWNWFIKNLEKTEAHIEE